MDYATTNMFFDIEFITSHDIGIAWTMPGEW